MAAPAYSFRGRPCVISPYNMDVWKPFDEIGQVAKVLTDSECNKYDSMALMLDDKTQKQVSVHLGPVWYLERHGFELFPGDVTEVKGIYKRGKNGNVSVVAYEVIKGDDVLVLRDSEGWPVWPGAGHPIRPRPMP
jgi:hypothetical protein